MPSTKKPFHMLPAAIQRAFCLQRRLSDSAERQRYIWAAAARFVNADLAVDEKAFEDLGDVLHYLITQKKQDECSCYYRAAGKFYPFDESPKFKGEVRRNQ